MTGRWTRSGSGRLGPLGVAVVAVVVLLMVVPPGAASTTSVGAHAGAPSSVPSAGSVGPAPSAAPAFTSPARGPAALGGSGGPALSVPIPFPPRSGALPRSPGTLAPYSQVVNPYAYYSSEPAPMGITDFGVTATGSGYTYSTSRFLGTAQISSWDSLTCWYCGYGGNFVSLQLNVIDVLTHGSSTLSYWIQDVPVFNTSSGYIDIENNIWNMTTYGASLSSGSLSGNGTVYSSGSGAYYADDAGYRPGANIDLSVPVNISAEVTTGTSSGISYVTFLYNDGYGWQSYDNVSYPWSTGWTNHGYVVDGTKNNGYGLFDDAEWIIGGPGNGASTVTQSANLSFFLGYWNGHNFQAAPNAYNFGSDTAESVSNIVATAPSGTSPGVPGAAIYADSGSLHRLYNSTDLGAVNVTPNSVNGSLSVKGTTTEFVGGNANISLLPGTYRVEQLNGTVANASANATIRAGHTVWLTMPGLSVSPQRGQAGTEVNITGRAFGGSASVSVTLATRGASLCNATTSSSGWFNCTATLPAVAAGPTEVTATDSSAETASAMAQFNLTTDLKVSARATPSASEVGVAANFSANATGGFTPYSVFGWEFGDGTNATTTQPWVLHAFAGGGTFRVLVNVTDRVGSVERSSVSIFVNARPIVSSLSASAPAADIGQNVTFTAGATLGTPPYVAFQWSGLPAGCAPSNTSTLDCTFVSAGRIRIQVTVTDSLGVTSTVGATLPYTVSEDPSVSTPVAAPASIDLGQTAGFEVSSTAGSGSDTFGWDGLPPGCAGSTSVIGCIPTATGTFPVSATITDSNGRTNASGAPLDFTVFSDPAFPPAPTLSSPSADVGETVHFSAAATGGSGGLVYAWSGLPVGCTAGAAPNVTCTPTLAGIYEVNVSVTDSNQASDSLAFAYEVVAQLVVAGPSETANVTDVGRSVTFGALAVGGAGGYHYSWLGLPNGCANAGARVVCTPTTSGDFLVNVTVTDLNGGSASGSTARLVVNAVPRVSALDESPGDLLVGQQLTLRAETSGGTPEYTYAWTGLPAGCAPRNATELSCYPNDAGSFSVTFRMTDAAGESANATLTVTVGSAFLGLPALEGYALVALIAAAVIVGAVLAFRAPRRPKAAAMPPPPPPPSS